MNHNDDITLLSAEQAATAAQDLLDGCNGDLEGRDAEQFERLVERAVEARQVQTRDRGNELVARLRSGELRTEAGSPSTRVTDDGTPARDERTRLFGRSAGSLPGDARLSPMAPSAATLEQLEEARREYRTLNLIETRSALDTAALRTGVEYASNGLPAPRNLWRASAIPTSLLPSGYKATVPLVTLPSAVALVSEGSNHGEFDTVEPDPVQLLRAGSWSDISAEALISSSLAEISTAHLHVISRNIDLALVGKLEQSPSGGVEDIDEVLAEVAGETSTDTSQLWIVGTAAAISTLAGNATWTPTNASDVGSYAVAYGAARLYVTPSASESQLTVFWPGGFRCFATALASGVVVDPKSGVQTFGSWQLFGTGQALAGSAITVTSAGS